MDVLVMVGTAKGAALLRAEASRERWSIEDLALPVRSGDTITILNSVAGG